MPLRLLTNHIVLSVYMTRNTALQICQFGFARRRELMFVTLDDVCETGSSNLAQKDILDLDGDFPIFGAAGYIGNVNFYHQEKPYLAVVKDGAGVGRVMLLPAKSSVIGTMQYLIPKEDIIVEYLYYAVKTMHLEKYYMGAAIPHIYFKDYKKEKLKLCSKMKQERIVARLDIIEKIINKHKQQLKNLGELTKARFVEMFGTEQEMNKWNCCTVGDVADVSVGVVIKPTQYYSDVGIPAFRSLNVGEMHVNDNDWVYFTREGHEKNKKSIIKNNDVLVVRSGAPGTACVATQKYEGYNAVDIMIARPYQEKIDSTFLAAFTNMPHGMNQIKTKTGGAAQKHFNVREYKTLTIVLPSLKYSNSLQIL